MYKLKYNSSSLLCIKTFIDSYKNNFVKLYFDSGLYNEDLIIENYIKAGDILYIEIKSRIKEVFSEEIVLGKRVGDNGELSIILAIGNYRLFIDYSENNFEKIRFIENIEFYKK